VNECRTESDVVRGCSTAVPSTAMPSTQTAITDANLNTAVIAWVTNPTTATTTYGPIADWNTAAVTSMASLLFPSSTARPTFNADISKWNVASVSNMYRVRLASVWTAYSFSYVSHTHTHTHTHAHTRTHTHSHTHTHAPAHTHTHAHICTHIYVYSHIHNTGVCVRTCTSGAVVRLLDRFRSHMK
jgi:hypothetical protein